MTTRIREYINHGNITKQLVKELEPGLNALFGLEYKQYENQTAEIYTTESSDRAFEEEVMLSGFAKQE